MLVFHFYDSTLVADWLFEEPLLPPANEVCEGYVFTGVCLSTGVSAPLHAGIHPPDERQIPPSRQTPLWADTPWQTRPRQTPPGRYPPVQCMLGDTGNKTGGTHPTGMHSCVKIFSNWDSVPFKCSILLANCGWFSFEKFEMVRLQDECSAPCFAREGLFTPNDSITVTVT